MTNNIFNLIKNLKKMQRKMQEMNRDIEKMQISGESGAGLVKVVFNGENICKKITIDPSLLKEKVEVIEGLVMAAINHANYKINEKKNSDITNLTVRNLKIPF
ncbi:YbaB/EbfC family nucleoid-associated protein [bacterium endosymbiont of Pedicinus badii]|uniref:YbaB/EbfC family nucleoid-associated protein n=1 Tax=bacterium endosymbiont of Pedicinus badii TaxID=1719126 RepID=UPI0009B9FBCB|nr:YbaB/EbfC family nucleoid-associated protein [bacterium endosymbiont of Pedicinus badii]OQM34297.1 hypothetical protein AOQ89_00135 [bacterium endosymbiont of Pedicinus badii]